MTVEHGDDSEHAAAVPSAPESRPDFRTRLKDHKVMQWALAYLGVALAVGEAGQLLSSAFEWPNVVNRAVLVTLIAGFPIAVTVAWYHGHRALRRVSVSEMSILAALLFMSALLFAIALPGSDAPGKSDGAAAAAPAADASPPTASAPLPNKIAVLPCENQSPDPADAYFAAGLHQDIIWQLGKLRNLTPIPRLTVLRYAGTGLAIPEIAAELRVEALLDCTVRYADDRLRITAELVDATGLETLWQDNYEPGFSDLADLFAVQADIAWNIATALSPAFDPGERALLEKPPTVSKEAYVLFLKGYDESDYDRTIELFEQAAAADPLFAAPKAALAFLWASELSNTNYRPAVAPEERAEHIAKVRAYAQQALELDASIPFARSALTIVSMLTWRWNEAYDGIVRARELTPNDVTQYDIFLLSYLGRHDAAMSVVERGEQLYPDEPDNWIWRGWALGFGGRYDEAAEAFAAAIEKAPGEQSLLARDWLARMEIARGNRTAAIEQLRLSENIAGAVRQPVFLPMWAYLYGRGGETGDARRLFAEMQEREAAGTRFGAGGWAVASLGVDDVDRAREWLAMAAEKAENHDLDEGFFNLMALRSNVANDERLHEPVLAPVLQRITGE
jgi:TolB-like protein/tetratricopeptide (TPR) repeat protein